MSILVSRTSRVLVQGLTGREGSFHTEQMKSYGTNVVAGVSPGKGGTTQLGVPIYDTVADARRDTSADISGIFVPAPFAADAIMEAAAAGIGLIVCITEGIPLYDMVRARAFVEDAGARLIGPNCPGVVTAGRAKVGIIPNHINREGSVGIVSRSGTLTYEVIQGLSQAGVGQTTSVGIGGDPILGLSFKEVLALFKADDVEPGSLHQGGIGLIERRRRILRVDHQRIDIEAAQQDRAAGGVDHPAVIRLQPGERPFAHAGPGGRNRSGETPGRKVGQDREDHDDRHQAKTDPTPPAPAATARGHRGGSFDASAAP